MMLNTVPSLCIWWNVKIAHCKTVAASEHSGIYLSLCVCTLCSPVKFFSVAQPL